MRSGHSAVAFFMPASAIAAITVSWMTGSVHSVMPSSTGRSRFSAFKQASLFVFAFLLM